MMTVSSMLSVVLSPSKLRYDASRSLTKTKRLKAALTACFSLSLALFLFVGMQVGAVFWASRQTVYAYEETFVIDSSNAAVQTPLIKTPSFDAANAVEVQAAVDAWSKKYNGRASVVITHTQSGAVLASAAADRQYFTASIYKLYIAYLTMQDIDAGRLDPNALLLGSSTIKECVYKMIQSSDSPCSEKMLANLTKTSVNQRLKDLGLTGTSLSSFKTTATDAALITSFISNAEGLQSQSASYLQKAMREQKYRDALHKGFKRSTVADKVGFYETGYHDTGTVVPVTGQSFTVSVLSENMGSRHIAELARSLEPILERL